MYVQMLDSVVFSGAQEILVYRHSGNGAHRWQQERKSPLNRQGRAITDMQSSFIAPAVLPRLQLTLQVDSGLGGYYMSRCLLCLSLL
jgi:hypothetical protein